MDKSPAEEAIKNEAGPSPPVEQANAITVEEKPKDSHNNNEAANENPAPAVVPDGEEEPPKIYTAHDLLTRNLAVLQDEKEIDPVHMELLLVESNLDPIMKILTRELTTNDAFEKEGMEADGKVGEFLSKVVDDIKKVDGSNVTLPKARWKKRRRKVKRTFEHVTSADDYEKRNIDALLSDESDMSGEEEEEEEEVTQAEIQRENRREELCADFIKNVVKVVGETVLGIRNTFIDRQEEEQERKQTDKKKSVNVVPSEDVKQLKHLARKRSEQLRALSRRGHVSDERMHSMRTQIEDLQAATHGMNRAQIAEMIERVKQLEQENEYLYVRAVGKEAVEGGKFRTQRMALGKGQAQEMANLKTRVQSLERLIRSLEQNAMNAADFDAAEAASSRTDEKLLRAMLSRSQGGDMAAAKRALNMSRARERQYQDDDEDDVHLFGMDPLPAIEGQTPEEREKAERVVDVMRAQRRDARYSRIEDTALDIISQLVDPTMEHFANVAEQLGAIQDNVAGMLAADFPKKKNMLIRLDNFRNHCVSERDSLISTIRLTVGNSKELITKFALLMRRKRLMIERRGSAADSDMLSSPDEDGDLKKLMSAKSLKKFEKDQHQVAIDVSRLTNRSTRTTSPALTVRSDRVEKHDIFQPPDVRVARNESPETTSLQSLSAATSARAAKMADPVVVPPIMLEASARSASGAVSPPKSLGSAVDGALEDSAATDTGDFFVAAGFGEMLPVPVAISDGTTRKHQGKGRRRASLEKKSKRASKHRVRRKTPQATPQATPLGITSPDPARRGTMTPQQSIPTSISSGVVSPVLSNDGSTIAESANTHGSHPDGPDAEAALSQLGASLDPGAGADPSIPKSPTKAMFSRCPTCDIRLSCEICGWPAKSPSASTSTSNKPNEQRILDSPSLIAGGLEAMTTPWESHTDEKPTSDEEDPDGVVIEKGEYKSVIKAALTAGAAHQELSHRRAKANFREMAASNAIDRQIRRMSENAKNPSFSHRLPDRPQARGTTRIDHASLEGMVERAAKIKERWENKRRALEEQKRVIEGFVFHRLQFSLYGDTQRVRVPEPSLEHLLNYAERVGQQRVPKHIAEARENAQRELTPSVQRLGGYSEELPHTAMPLSTAAGAGSPLAAIHSPIAVSVPSPRPLVIPVGDGLFELSKHQRISVNSDKQTAKEALHSQLMADVRERPATPQDSTSKPATPFLVSRSLRTAGGLTPPIRSRYPGPIGGETFGATSRTPPPRPASVVSASDIEDLQRAHERLRNERDDRAILNLVEKHRKEVQEDEAHARKRNNPFASSNTPLPVTRSSIATNLKKKRFAVTASYESQQAIEDSIDFIVKPEKLDSNHPQLMHRHK